MFDFGGTLKQLRTSHKLTQTQLAEKLGLAFSTISMYERGERVPDFEIIEAIADYFNVSLYYLLGDTSAPKTARTIPDEDLKFALWGGDCDEITDEMLNDVKRYAEFVRSKKNENN